MLALAALALTAAARDLPTITMGLESHCPHSGRFVHDLTHEFLAFPEWTALVGSFQVLYDGRPQASGQVTCFHGPEECRAQRFSLCADQMVDTPTALSYQTCGFGDCPPGNVLLNPCSTQYMLPDCCEAYSCFPTCTCPAGAEGCGLGIIEECAAGHGIGYDELKACADSTVGEALHYASATEMTIDRGMEYCFSGCPVVAVNNATISSSWQRLSIDQLKANLCDAYEGAERPAVCAGVPPMADLPSEMTPEEVAEAKKKYARV